jgi:hypothetical protein
MSWKQLRIRHSVETAANDDFCGCNEVAFTWGQGTICLVSNFSGKLNLPVLRHLQKTSKTSLPSLILPSPANHRRHHFDPSKALESFFNARCPVYSISLFFPEIRTDQARLSMYSPHANAFDILPPLKLQIFRTLRKPCSNHMRSYG